jgi:hypothetical protein
MDTKGCGIRTPDWNRLTDSGERVVCRGAVFRFPAKYPYENYVDFMLIEDTGSSSGFSFVVSTGYKAGLIVLQVPQEALARDMSGLDCIWLRTNWQTWLYAGCPVDEVHFYPGYSEPTGTNAEA